MRIIAASGSRRWGETGFQLWRETEEADLQTKTKTTREERPDVNLLAYSLSTCGT
jgi:hypothetical protein